jgi:RNA polymerase sigma-70 factor (ECF subfamily)
MAEHANDAGQWLTAARAGSSEALGQALEACRLYLLAIADKELATHLRAKGGASDLVQETFVDAQKLFPRFHGHTENELLAWLRELLLHNLADFNRRYLGTGKRKLSREVSLSPDSSSGEPALQLPADGLTPSTKAMAPEQAAALDRALEGLPPEYREVLRMRYEEDLSFEEIGQRMERSANAARKLWLRAVQRLQQQLGASP